MFLTSHALATQDQATEARRFAVVLEQLLEGDFRTRWEATKSLKALGPETITHLLPLLKDQELDCELHWFIARLLGEFEDAAALAALVDLLQDATDAELVAIAAQGVACFGAAGIETLAQLLEQAEFRLIGTQALASIRHPAVFAPLMSVADDENPAVRLAVITALANFHNTWVDELLVRSVKDLDVQVRQEAIATLGLRSDLLQQINLVDILLPGLWDLHPSVNKATAIALGRLGTETAVSSLAKILTSPHTGIELKITVVRALCWIEKESALLALLAAKRTSTSAVQIEIARVLTQLQSPSLKQRAADILFDWLSTELTKSDKDYGLLQAIAFTLGSLQHLEAKPLLESLAQIEHPRTQLYAEAALKQLATA